MNHFLHGVARALSETFHLDGPILEIGSYQVEGQESIGNLRGLFPSKEYLGLDIRPGPGVDCVASVEELPQADESAGTVLACNTFEHVRRFWRGFEEIRRVLRPDGALIVSCPFFFRVHNFPEDYWRFTPDALKFLLGPYPSKIIGWHGPRHRPLHVWALAYRENREPITAQQFAQYRRLLDQYAREPERSWTRRLRYRMASLLCGRGPFAAFLDRERWESVCLNNKTDAHPAAHASDAWSPYASSTGTAGSCCEAASTRF